MPGQIVILGVFVADTSFRTDRLPKMGETVLGKGFALGPGGKGSNQAVAAARTGGDVHFITRLGKDAFADMALATWKEAGVTPQVTHHPDSYTGAACVCIDDATGDNAIIVSPGAAAMISPADIDVHAGLIAGAEVFMTQLEQPLDAAAHALQLARDNGTTTILNPAPAATLTQGVLGLCDYVTPNESEAAALTGVEVETIDDAIIAAEVLLSAGVGTAIITLGENGVVVHDGTAPTYLPAFNAGKVVETTGAGDAFNGGFAAALARGEDPVEAVLFGCATAAISVTRPGTAASMPARKDVHALLMS